MSLVINPPPSTLHLDSRKAFEASGAGTSRAELPPPSPGPIAGPSRSQLALLPTLHTRNSSPTALHTVYGSAEPGVEAGSPVSPPVRPSSSGPTPFPGPPPPPGSLPPAGAPLSLVPVPNTPSPAQREMPSLPPTLPPTPEPSPPDHKVLFPEYMVKLAPPAGSMELPAMAIDLSPVERRGSAREDDPGQENKIPVIHIDALPPDSPERPVEIRKRLSSRRKMPMSKQVQHLVRLQESQVPNQSAQLQIDVDGFGLPPGPRRASLEEGRIASTSRDVIPQPTSRVSLDMSQLESYQSHSPPIEPVFKQPVKPRGPRRSYTAYSNPHSHAYAQAQSQPISSLPMSPSQSTGASGPMHSRPIHGGPRHTSHNSSLSSQSPPGFPRTHTAPIPSAALKPTPLPELNIHDTNGIEAKVALFGSLGAGKTSLVARYMRNTYSATPVPATIGGEFYTRKTKQDGVKISLQLWDTAGQERFRAMAPIYYRNAHVCILVYDITSRDSFLDVKTWIDEIREKVPESMIFVVGAKADKAERRAVSRMEVRVQIREWLRTSATEVPVDLSPLASGVERRSSGSSKHSTVPRQPSQPYPTRSTSQSAFSFLNPAFSRSTPSLVLGSPPSKPRSSVESTRESILSTKQFPATLYQSSQVFPPLKRDVEPLLGGEHLPSRSSRPSISFPIRAPTVTFMEPVPAHFTPASPTTERPIRSSRFSISGLSEVLGLGRTMSISGAVNSLARVAEEHQVPAFANKDRSFGAATPRGSSIGLNSDVAPSITEFGPLINSPTTGLRAFGPHHAFKPALNRSRTESSPFGHARVSDLRRKSEDLSALASKLKIEEASAKQISMSRQSSEGVLDRPPSQSIPSPRPGNTRRRSGSLGTGPQLTFTSATPSSYGSTPAASRRGSTPLVSVPIAALPSNDPSNDSFLPTQRGKSWLEAPDHLPWGRDVEGIRVGEVSALTGEGVKELFEAIAMRLVEKGDKIRKDTLLRRKKSFVLTAPEDDEVSPAPAGASGRAGGGWWFGWCAT